MPTMATIVDATELDNKLHIVQDIVSGKLPPDFTNIADKVYTQEFKHDRLKVEDNAIFHYEVLMEQSLRQLHTVLVPSAL